MVAGAGGRLLAISDADGIRIRRSRLPSEESRGPSWESRSAARILSLKRDVQLRPVVSGDKVRVKSSPDITGCLLSGGRFPPPPLPTSVRHPVPGGTSPRRLAEVPPQTRSAPSGRPVSATVPPKPGRQSHRPDRLLHTKPERPPKSSPASFCYLSATFGAHLTPTPLPQTTKPPGFPEGFETRPERFELPAF